MPLPWKKARTGRISRFVADLQQSPKHGGSLVVETGFPTSLIDLFVKNRDRLKKSSSKRRQSAVISPSPSQRSSPPLPLPRQSSFPPVPASRDGELVKRTPVGSKKIQEPAVAGFTSEKNSNGDGGGGRRSFLVVMVKVFAVAILASSTKKLTAGITISAFALLFLEFIAARAFTLLESLLHKFLGKRKKEKAVAADDRDVVACEITETFEGCTDVISRSEPESVEIQVKNSVDPSVQSSVDLKTVEVPEEREEQRQTIRDLMFTKERSRSSKLKSKIVKKMVPKKFRRKKKSMKIEEDEGSLTEVSSTVSDDKSERIEGEISAIDDQSSNPPLLESFREVEESQKGSRRAGNSKTNAIVLLVMMLVGLLGGKLVAIGLFLSWCLILRFADNKYLESQKTLPHV